MTPTTSVGTSGTGFQNCYHNSLQGEALRAALGKLTLPGTAMWRKSAPKGKSAPGRAESRQRESTPVRQARPSLGLSTTGGVIMGRLQSECRQALASEDKGIIGSILEGSALIVSSIYYTKPTQYLLKERSLDCSCLVAGDSHYQDVIHSFHHHPVESHLRLSGQSRKFSKVPLKIS